MKDANGFHVDIAQANVERDMTIIRMNVDDLDEAYALLTARQLRYILYRGRTTAG